ncbi:MAG: hypothetical protein E7015_01760 [Alphaproteobacteria bacterium]|nr:hypothetical protein [Alphaproteobacteria bacterium]
MKKLLCCLSFAVNLFGLSPSIVSQSNNPSEEQVAQMYQNVQLDFEAWKKLAIDEVNAISRPLSAQEKIAVSKFIEKLSSPIDEVKIIDAESFINGLYLNKQRKNYFIQLLSNGQMKGIRRLFAEFVDKVEFSDIVLKNKVLDRMISGSNSSDVYKNLMVSYIAMTESMPSICVRYIYPESCMINKVEWSNYSSSSYRLIRIDRAYNSSVFYSYFKTNMGRLKSNVFAYCEDIEYVSFHEMGHSVDYFSTAMICANVDKTIERITSDFYNLTVSVERFDANRELIKKRYKQNLRV